MITKVSFEERAKLEATDLVRAPWRHAGVVRVIVRLVRVIVRVVRLVRVLRVLHVVRLVRVVRACARVAGGGGVGGGGGSSLAGRDETTKGAQPARGSDRAL